ncbi:hypothetical protein VTJ04DRAFT_10315 [Mycothermus thermophilus]|uniref:uncharacterized protein n=1 Tax=Humicola insolens TaxID=85995 RepID=UPI003744267F
MRHLFRAHPGRRKKDKKKTNPEITMTGGVGVGPYPPHRPELNPAPSGATTLETSRGASMGKSSGFNPLSLLSQEQMTVFVMRVFAVLVVVGMREMQSEKEREVDTVMAELKVSWMNRSEDTKDYGAANKRKGRERRATRMRMEDVR